MYRFWYDVLVKNYGERVEYVYSDTDSFVISLEVDDLEKEIKEGPLAEYLDLSNFPPGHYLYNDKFKGHLGKLKIETAPEFIHEFIGLKPKAYSFTTTNSDTSKNTLKGVPHHIRKNITINQYKECLYNNNPIHSDIHNLRFYKSEMSLVKTRKLTLSPFEDKRFYINANTSYGYGHPKTRLHERDNIIVSEEEEEEDRVEEVEEEERVGEERVADEEEEEEKEEELVVDEEEEEQWMEDIVSLLSEYDDRVNESKKK